MGPLRFVPFLECNHGIISMRHALQGSIRLDAEVIDFSDGLGYIEQDWGNSFPKKYLWTQCNSFAEKSCSVMASIADVPFFGRTFRGLIALLNCRGKEYRFASYRGARIVRCDQKGLVIRQGKYRLELDVIQKDGQRLLAPHEGKMTRVILEEPSISAQYRLFIKNHLLYDLISDQASFEFAE